MAVDMQPQALCVLQVSVDLSLGSHQPHCMQAGSPEKAPAVKWTSLTLALETTVHAQTSTVSCLRMMCSPYPRSPDRGVTAAISRVEAGTPSP